MAGLITKVFVTSGLLGGIGGLSYAVTYYLSGYTLGDTLKDKGHNLLSYEANNSENRAEWEKILTAYSNNKAKLNGKEITVTDSKPTTQNINELKAECAKAVASNSYSDETRLLTEQYCVEPVTVIQLMRKQKGEKVLDWTTEDKTNKDNTRWDAKINRHSSLPPEKQIEGLKFGSDVTTEEAKRTKFKEWCKGFEGNRTYDKEYHKKYSEFLEWCIA